MMQSKACPACEHVEGITIDNALSIGMSPRRIIRRYAGLSRKAIQRHRDKRHHETTANGKRSSA